ncbi:MAG: GNVR domain-containing protein [Paracoccaceae bacterium]
MTDANPDVIDLRGLVALLRRQVRLIALTTAVVLGAALLYLLQAAPIYRAGALILVDPSYKNILVGPTETTTSGSAENARLESELEILQSPKVLLSTIERTRLVEDPEFGPAPSLFDKLRFAVGAEASADPAPAQVIDATLQEFRDATSVRRRGLTYLLDISVASRSPEKAANLANALARTYIDLQLAAKVDLALGSRDLLQRQLDTARDALAQSEDRVDGYLRDNADRIAEETGNTNVARLGVEFGAVDRQRLGREIARRDADAALAAQDWGRLVDALNDQSLAARAKQRSEIALRLGQLPEGSEEEVSLRNGLAEIENSMKMSGQDSIAGLRQEIAELTRDTNRLRTDLRKEVLGGDLSSTTLTAIYELQQEADIAQRHYTTLLSRMRDLEAQAVVQVADSRIVSEALPPALPAWPKRMLVLALAGAIGLGGGVGLAFLSETYAGGIVAPSALADILPASAATANAIPRVEPKSHHHSVSDLLRDAPLSAYAEALRKLRAAVDQAVLRPHGAKVIMVTSALPGEGKTSVALGLARTYAAAGSNVLLIDGDMRKPSLHRHLGLEPRIGFSEFLTSPDDTDAPDDFYCLDPQSGLGAILGRDRPTVPTDRLLRSDTFAKLIKHARSVVDVVIIDTSPLIPVVDARYVVPVADVVILAVRYAATTQSDFRAAYEQIVATAGTSKPVIAVLNADATVSAYGYDGYYTETPSG